MVGGKFEKSGCAYDVLVKSFFGFGYQFENQIFINNFEMFEFLSLQ